MVVNYWHLLCGAKLCVAVGEKQTFVYTHSGVDLLAETISELG